MQLQQHQLKGSYTWNNGTVYTGQPSRRTFDVTNGHQVLFIINFVADSNNKFTLDNALTLEQEILLNLPADAKSELSVFHWIRSFLREEEEARQS
jgi:hypothetical protein